LKEYQKLNNEYNAEIAKLSKQHDNLLDELEKEKRRTQGMLKQFHIQKSKQEESKAQLKANCSYNSYIPIPFDHTVAAAFSVGGKVQLFTAMSNVKCFFCMTSY